MLKLEGNYKSFKGINNRTTDDKLISKGLNCPGSNPGGAI